MPAYGPADTIMVRDGVRVSVCRSALARNLGEVRMLLESLYKYGCIEDQIPEKLERAEHVFSSDQLWFSSPVSMNDPFECQPKFVFSATDDQIVTFFVKEFQRRYGISVVEALERAHQVLALGRHKDQTYYDQVADDLASRIKTEIGMYCMSATGSNILMWSHYAKDHTGYCLEFESTSGTPFFGAAQEVIYSESYPTVDYFNTTLEQQVEALLLTKYIDWGYEKEWRIIDHVHGTGLKTYPAALLKSVTFGLRMSEKHKDWIREWIARRGHNVPLYQAIQDRYQFGITRRLVS